MSLLDTSHPIQLTNQANSPEQENIQQSFLEFNKSRSQPHHVLRLPQLGWDCSMLPASKASNYLNSFTRLVDRL
nr:hypothetical protein Q903MT_gene3249 [Picea sitchensis]